MIVNKKVKLNLIGVDGNAFTLMAKFSEAAKDSKWTDAETNTVLSEAISKDYNHLLKTISEHCE